MQPGYPWNQSEDVKSVKVCWVSFSTAPPKNRNWENFGLLLINVRLCLLYPVAGDSQLDCTCLVSYVFLACDVICNIIGPTPVAQLYKPLSSSFRCDGESKHSFWAETQRRRSKSFRLVIPATWLANYRVVQDDGGEPRPPIQYRAVYLSVD